MPAAKKASTKRKAEVSPSEEAPATPKAPVVEEVAPKMVHDPRKPHRVRPYHEAKRRRK